MPVRQLLIAALLVAAASTASAEICTSMARAVSHDADPTTFRVVGLGWNGSAIGVAKLRTGSASEIDFGLYDSDLNQVGSDNIVASATGKSFVEVGSNGDGFGIIYLDPAREEIFQAISADGRPAGSPVVLFGAEIQKADAEISRLLWDGQEWVFARTTVVNRTRTVRLEGMDTTGNILHETDLPLVDTPAVPEIAVDGNLTDILWRGFESNGTPRLFVTVVDMTRASQPLTVSSSSGLTPRAAWDGEAFDTIVKDEVNEQLDLFQSDAQSNLLSDPSPFVTAPGTDVVAASSLDSAGGALLLEYTDSRSISPDEPGAVHIVRFLPDGTELSDINESFVFSLSNFSLTTRMLVLPESQSAVSAVAQQNQSNGGWNSSLVKLCPLSLAIDVPDTWRIGQPVTLQAAPSGGIAPYNVAWDFGDGFHSAGTSVTHTFNANRTFPVKIHVTDLLGEVADAVAPITISDLPPLTIGISVSSPANARRETRFFAFLSGGIAPLSVTWDFGDGTMGDGVSVGHTYQTAGTYFVTATATDRAGGTATTGQDVVVLPSRPHAIERH